MGYHRGEKLIFKCFFRGYVFAGIVQGMGQVILCQPRDYGLLLGLRAPAQCLDGLSLGCSISVNGVCLTLVASDGPSLFFDVIHETLERTNLRWVRLGEYVNLERALKIGEEVGGHIVSGHVCGIGKIQSFQGQLLTVITPQNLFPYWIEKGFVAVDGVSVTIASVGERWFSVGLIPETLRRTTLGTKGIDMLVNLEPDMSIKTQVDTLERLLTKTKYAIQDIR